MILLQDDFDEYVEANYPDVTDSLSSKHRIFEYCPYCRAPAWILFADTMFTS